MPPMRWSAGRHILRLAMLAVGAGAIVVCAGGGIVSAASHETTVELLRKCEGRAPIDPPVIGQLICTGYIDGILDFHAVMVAAAGATPQFCVPQQGISIEQAMRVFVKWANENPAQLHETARVSVLLAMREAFPCRHPR